MIPTGVEKGEYLYSCLRH